MSRRLVISAGLLGILSCVGACSSENAPSDSSHGNAASDATPDAVAEAGISVDLCKSPDDVETNVIADSYALAALDDCRVAQLLLLGPQDGTAFLERLTSWTSAFFGCPSSPGGVTTFGPAETGKHPALTQADVDVLSKHYVDQLEAFLKLSPAEVALVKQKLAILANAAVNSPGSGHSYSVCIDAGSDGGTDAAIDSGVDGGSVDAGQDAEDASSGDGGFG